MNPDQLACLAFAGSLSGAAGFSLWVHARHHHATLDRRAPGRVVVGGLIAMGAAWSWLQGLDPAAAVLALTATWQVRQALRLPLTPQAIDATSVAGYADFPATEFLSTGDSAPAASTLAAATQHMPPDAGLATELASESQPTRTPARRGRSPAKKDKDQTKQAS